MASNEDKLDLAGLLNKIDQNATEEQVEKLRLLAAAVTDYGNVSDVRKVPGTPEIYREVAGEFKEESNAIAMFKRLLVCAGYPKRFTEQLTDYMSPSPPTPDFEKLYFYELLVKVANQVGNGEYFRYLRNRIPRSVLDINRDRIASCVQLFQKLEMNRVLNPSSAAASLTKLEEWLKDINRDDVAEIVRKRIDEIRGEPNTAGCYDLLCTYSLSLYQLKVGIFFFFFFQDLIVFTEYIVPTCACNSKACFLWLSRKVLQRVQLVTALLLEFMPINSI